MFAFNIIAVILLAAAIVYLLYVGIKAENATVAFFLLPTILSEVFASLTLGGVTVPALGVLSIIFVSLMALFVLILTLYGTSYGDRDIAVGGAILLGLSIFTLVYLGCAL